MKKSIAFIGAFFMGALAFAQVSKTDTINKTASRKVSSDDLKKFPVDTETDSAPGHMKVELSTTGDDKNGYIRKLPSNSGVSEKHTTFEKQTSFEKQTPDASAGKGSTIKGSVTQKGRTAESISPTEKAHYTVKMTNANNKTQSADIQKTGSVDGEATTQKKHVSNIKWTPGKVALDTTATPTSGKSEIFMKITDVKGE